MHVDVRQADNREVIIVDIQGKLVRGTVGAELFGEVCDELLRSNWRKILLNLAEVTIIDSSGIGELVAGLKRAREVGGTIKIVRPTDRVRTTFIHSSILPLFEIFDDEAKAVESF